MTTNRAPLLASVLAAIVCMLIVLTVPAEAGVKIVRLVNDEPITSLDVQRRAKFYSVTQRKSMSSGLRSQALEELTEEILKRQEARRLGVSADPAEIDAAFNTIAQRVKMSPTQLVRAFRSVGVDANTLRSRIEADVLWRGVIRQRFSQEVRIRDQDVQQALSAKTGEAQPVTIEFELQQILLILPKDASVGKINARKREAEAIRQRFAGCADMRGAIEGHRDVVYKRIGRRLEGDLPEKFRQGVIETPAGKLSPPVHDGNAVVVMAVCSRQEVEDDSAVRRQVQVDMRNEQGQILARRLIIDLRQSAVIENR